MYHCKIFRNLFRFLIVTWIKLFELFFFSINNIESMFLLLCEQYLHVLQGIYLTFLLNFSNLFKFKIFYKFMIKKLCPNFKMAKAK